MNTILSIASTFYRFLQRQMTKMWWKIIVVILILYTLIAGFLLGVPDKFILNETIRNLYFHVPMWMGMLSVFVMSVFYSIKYLNNGQEKDDLPLLNA